MGGGDTDRRDRRKGRDKADRQTERDFGGKGKTEDTEGSGLAEFVKGDLNGRDEGQEVEGFGRGGAECTSDPAEGLVLDDLEFIDQGTFGSVRPIPELAPICDDRDDAGVVQEAHVVGGQTADCVA